MLRDRYFLYSAKSSIVSIDSKESVLILVYHDDSYEVLPNRSSLSPKSGLTIDTWRYSNILHIKFFASSLNVKIKQEFPVESFARVFYRD